MMKSSTGGYTLLELLVAGVVVAVLTLALASAFGAAVTYPQLAEESRSREAARISFEARIRELLENATVTAIATDRSTYFLAGEEAAGEATRITFTSEAPSIPERIKTSADDFEAQNQVWGPQGGLREISIGLVPVGQAPEGEGVFLREQRPADGDFTQGGWESTLDSEVSDVQWEFFDGTNWLTEWDSRATQRRIPAAVRLTYYLGTETDPKVVVVRLLKSDVTPENPVLQAGTGGSQ